MDEDYEKKRKKKANEAVIKCREKARKKADEIAKTIETLKKDNHNLEGTKISLSTELATLKELYTSLGGK